MSLVNLLNDVLGPEPAKTGALWDFTHATILSHLLKGEHWHKTFQDWGLEQQRTDPNPKVLSDQASHHRIADQHPANTEAYA